MKVWIDKNDSKIFLLLLLLVFWLLGVFEFIQLEPVSLHFMRQTDSLAFVDFFKRNGYDFLQPGGWYLGDSEGKAAGEFPILYFLTAVISNIGIPNHIVLRTLTLTLVTVGFFHLFRLLKLIFEDTITSLSFAFLFLSSTVLLFYALNFLPDAAALGLSLSGYYFGVKARKTKQNLYYRYAILAFAFAGLLKITFLIHPIAFFSSLFFIEFWYARNIQAGLAIHYKEKVLFLISIFFVIVWYAYASIYNKQYQSEVFLTTFIPIWEFNRELILRVWLAIHHDWFSSYYYNTTFHVLFSLIVIGFFIRNKFDPFYRLFLVFLVLGSLTYVILFYSQFLDHDYYMLNIAPLFFLLVIFSYKKITERFPKIFKHFTIKILFAVLPILSLSYSSNKLAERFNNSLSFFEKNIEPLKGINVILDQKYVSKNAKFLICSEETRNGAFNQIKRPGWNISKREKNWKSKFYRRLPEADYLILTPDINDLNLPDYQFKFTFHKLRVYQNINKL